MYIQSSAASGLETARGGDVNTLEVTCNRSRSVLSVIMLELCDGLFHLLIRNRNNFNKFQLDCFNRILVSSAPKKSDKYVWVNAPRLLQSFD